MAGLAGRPAPPPPPLLLGLFSFGSNMPHLGTMDSTRNVLCKHHHLLSSFALAAKQSHWTASERTEVLPCCEQAVPLSLLTGYAAKARTIGSSWMVEFPPQGNSPKLHIGMLLENTKVELIRQAFSNTFMYFESSAPSLGTQLYREHNLGQIPATKSSQSDIHTTL